MITKPLKTDTEENEEENGRKKYNYSFVEIAQKISENEKEESLTNTKKEEDN
ncbi:MAG: hypothetical protein ACOYMA_09760 [Bacteroidia bacterium]